MGEAKRRKQTDPNYGIIPQGLNFIINLKHTSNIDVTGSDFHNLSADVEGLGKIAFSYIGKPSLKISKSFDMPRDCAILPFVINEYHIGLFFTKLGFSKAFYLGDENLKLKPDFNNISDFFSDGRILKPLLDITKFLVSNNRVLGGIDTLFPNLK